MKALHISLIGVLFAALSLTANCQTFTNSQACTNCQDASISGTNASGLGTSPIATGSSSLAGGFQSESRGQNSLAFGNHAITASMGINAFAFGFEVESNAPSSFTLGRFLKSNSSAAFVIGSGAGSAGYLENSQAGSLMVGFNSKFPTLFVSNSSGSALTGKIGIGNITNPTSKLHLLADENEAAEIQLEHRSTGFRQYAQLLLGTHSIRAGNNENMVFTTPTNRNFAFVTGNVGINTTAPSQKLDIDGNIRLRNNAIIGTWSNNSLTFNTNSRARMVVLADGKVGIGTNTPNTELDIAGNITVSGLANQQNGQQIVTSDVNGKLTLMNTSSLGDNMGNCEAGFNLKLNNKYISNDGSSAGIRLDNRNNVGISGNIDVNGNVYAPILKGSNLPDAPKIELKPGGLDNSRSIKFIVDGNTSNHQFFIGSQQKLVINQDRIVIGAPENKISLNVNGKINAGEVQVALTNWDTYPDYVFDADYIIPNLIELENFILLNKHLPNVPTVEQAKLSGINLGDMNMILLEKIEELTLYMIDLQKNNIQMNDEIERLKATLTLIQNQIP